MTRNQFNEKVVDKRIALIKEVLGKKANEYALDGSAFGNFEDGSKIAFANGREKYAWELMTKHLQSLKDMIEHVSIDGANGYPTEAIIEEKCGDIINYVILLEGMLKERVYRHQK